MHAVFSGVFEASQALLCTAQCVGMAFAGFLATSASRGSFIKCWARDHPTQQQSAYSRVSTRDGSQHHHLQCYQQQVESMQPSGLHDIAGHQLLTQHAGRGEAQLCAMTVWLMHLSALKEQGAGRE